MSGPWSGRAYVGLKYSGGLSDPLWEVVVSGISFSTGWKMVGDVPPTTTLYLHSTYDLRRAGSSRPIFNRVKILSRLPRSLRAGPTNPLCTSDQHTLSPIKTRSLPIRQYFKSGNQRGLIGSLVWRGKKICSKWFSNWTAQPVADNSARRYTTILNVCPDWEISK